MAEFNARYDATTIFAKDFFIFIAFTTWVNKTSLLRNVSSSAGAAYGVSFFFPFKFPIKGALPSVTYISLCAGNLLGRYEFFFCL